VHEGGGLAEDAEDIRVEEFDYKTVFQLVDREEICDAKSLIALHWFRCQSLM
jgi:hypothetical protein